MRQKLCDPLIRKLEKTMIAAKFRKLLNGGAAVAGVEGLRQAIADLERTREAHCQELAGVPGKRADLLLADDYATALDALEIRERELYREIEKIDLQVAALKPKLAEQQGVFQR